VDKEISQRKELHSLSREIRKGLNAESRLGRKNFLCCLWTPGVCEAKTKWLEPPVYRGSFRHQVQYRAEMERNWGSLRGAFLVTPKSGTIFQKKNQSFPRKEFIILK
jgi:hypothetical protein